MTTSRSWPMLPVSIFAFLAMGLVPSLAAGKDITFDDLKFDIEAGGDFKREMLTEEIEALHGKVVTVRGVMLPSFQAKGIKNFVLLRDNKCLFGPKGTVCHNIIVELAPGKTTEFTTKYIAVEGRLKISELKGPSGKVLSIYHLDARSVK